MAQNYDVAVIGAGIVGVSTAMHLLMRGKKVVLLDRKGAGLETSYGNAGVIGNCYIVPFSFPALKSVPGILLGRSTVARIHYSSIPRNLPWLFDLYLKSSVKAQRQISEQMWPFFVNSVEEHRVLMRGTNAEQYLLSAGHATLYRSEAAFAASPLARDIARERGVPFEVLDYAAFKEFEPHINPVYTKAVRWPGSPRLTNPGAVTTAYAKRFIDEGGTFINTNVKALHTFYNDRWQVETGQGEITVDHVAVCAGPWVSDLIRPLGYHFPMTIKRGYHQHFSVIGDATLSHSISAAEDGYALVKMEQGYRITTGVEFANLGSPPTPVQLTRVFKKAKELFPLDAPLDPKPWLGNRPCFADSLPVIGHAPRHKGLWFNFGHGHFGMTMGPPSGRLLAEMMTNAPTFCDTAPYRAARFNG